MVAPHAELEGNCRTTARAMEEVCVQTQWLEALGLKGTAQFGGQSCDIRRPARREWNLDDELT